MPTYEYICDGCEHSFEKFQSITAKPIRKCPKCKQNKVRRLIGCGSALLFKGSGFYQTDYRSESYKKAAKEDNQKQTGTKTKDSKATTDSTKEKTKTKSKEPA